MIHAKCSAIGQDIPPAGDQRGKRAPVILSLELTFPCHLEEMRTIKTAWEYYNEGMYAATARYSP